MPEVDHFRDFRRGVALLALILFVAYLVPIGYLMWTAIRGEVDSPPGTAGVVRFVVVGLALTAAAVTGLGVLRAADVTRARRLGRFTGRVAVGSGCPAGCHRCDWGPSGMSFTVNTNAIRGYARELRDAAGDARAGRDYIVAHTMMAWHQEGLLNELQPAHERLVTELTSRLQHLVEIFDQCGAVLDGAAGHYRGTDAASAARVDAALPLVSRGDEEMYDTPRGY